MVAGAGIWYRRARFAGQERTHTGKGGGRTHGAVGRLDGDRRADRMPARESGLRPQTAQSLLCFEDKNDIKGHIPFSSHFIGKEPAAWGPGSLSGHTARPWGQRTPPGPWFHCPASRHEVKGSSLQPVLGCPQGGPEDRWAPHPRSRQAPAGFLLHGDGCSHAGPSSGADCSPKHKCPPRGMTPAGTAPASSLFLPLSRILHGPLGRVPVTVCRR